ncbi:unnamed protein product [marine sediment metagenome]|uniref:Uncharacterized protein n=1 Tax=marine sediment metagenome TaxID=412755 RepID=X1BGL2_9ZZZZ
METLDYEIQVNKISDWVRLWFFADTHQGTVACAETHMRNTVKEIADDSNAYACHMGDIGDFINYTDPRFEIYGVVPELRHHLDDLPRQQVKTVKNIGYELISSKATDLVRVALHDLKECPLQDLGA